MASGEQPDAWAQRLDESDRELQRRQDAGEDPMTLADERDKLADERDALAGVLDEIALSRDGNALKRDQRASARDVAARRPASEVDPGFAERYLSGVDRDHAAGDRSDSAEDRRRAAIERHKATSARREAAEVRQSSGSAARAASDRVEQMAADLHASGVLNQAQGRLMQRYEVSASAAYEMLADLAAREGVDIEQMARRIADLGPRD